MFAHLPKKRRPKIQSIDTPSFVIETHMLFITGIWSIVFLISVPIVADLGGNCEEMSFRSEVVCLWNNPRPNVRYFVLSKGYFQCSKT